jgi:Family of unknown function (DUF5996)
MSSTGWADTIATLRRWTQVIGKIKLAQMPPVNHWWHTTLFVSGTGLTTGSMPYEDRLLEFDLDFVGHRFTAEASEGGSFSFDLRPMSVASFYHSVMDGLGEMGMTIPIRTRPVEVELAIPFEQDEFHATYDRDHIAALWEQLDQAHRVLSVFRGGFIGKCSPVHFFWGGFDLAVTRFSGRRAPEWSGTVTNCPTWVMHEAYSHEVSSAGWWPGSDTTGPAFYSYMYPEPAGFSTSSLAPAPGAYDHDFGEFILANAEADESNDPDSTVLSFLQATYESGATLAGWNREELERSYNSAAPRLDTRQPA